MVCALMAASSAHAQPSCPQVLTYEGDPAWVDRIDTHLREGMLADVSAEECTDTLIVLEREGRRIRFRVRRGDHVAEHVTDDPEAVAIWIESWLMPVATVEVEASPEPTHFASDSSAAATAETTMPTATTVVALEAATEDERPPAHVEVARVEPEWRIPVRLDALLTFDADRTAPIWWGGEASLGLEVRPKLWFALAVAGQVAPKVNAETRRALRVSLRSGWTSRSDNTEVRLGLGFGFSYAHAERETTVRGEEVEIVDDAALPLVEAYWDIRYALSAHIGLVVGLVLRGNIPDGLNDRQPDDGDVPGEQLAPYPDARGSISLRVGLSWGSAR